MRNKKNMEIEGERGIERERESEREREGGMKGDIEKIYYLD